jgi:hypothetical protein
MRGASEWKKIMKTWSGIKKNAKKKELLPLTEH